MQSALGPGDEVVTIGGLYGTVVGVDDDTVTVEVAPGVQSRYARPAIARVVTRAERPEADEPVTRTRKPSRSECPTHSRRGGS